ncbi:MAG: sensor histidine kinase [Gammaproteobacteria bacterium]
MNAQANSRRAYWLCQCAGWGFYTAARWYAAVTLVHLPWARVTVELLLLDGTALVLSHWLRAFVGRHRWNRLGMRRMVPRALAASVVLAVPLAVITLWTSVSALQDPGPLFDAFAPAFLARFSEPILLALHIINWAIVFALWLTIYFIVTSQRQRRLAELHESELARALQLAQLRVLKTQLNPHFLFNSLNTVRSLIADDPARAQRAVTHLANTLRYTLSTGHDELVSLAQELDIVREYLALETMRFEERLSVEFNVAPGTGNVRIPVMLLQTVVENAIKHGIAELPEGGTIMISVRRADGVLSMQVENPRPQRAASVAGDGIGLRNADERLRLLFGSDASLDLDLSSPSLATVRIRIPHPT